MTIINWRFRVAAAAWLAFVCSIAGARAEVTRIDARTLRYQFTVEDPDTWTRPWTAEYAWPATNDLLYEYACQEGNYALGNILRGARLKEKDEAAAKKSK